MCGISIASRLSFPFMFLCLLRQLSLGCKLFAMCSIPQITCQVKEKGAGDWTRVTSPRFCEAGDTFENTQIFTTSANFSSCCLSNSSLAGLLSQALVIRLRVGQIESGAFQSLVSVLEVLDISENQLSNFSKGLFRGLNKVRRLDLSLNKFISVPTEALKPLTGLKDLRLARNEIRYIGRNDMASLPRLTAIDLSYNGITRIDLRAFEPLPDLRTLSLQRNNFDCGCDMLWLRDYNTCLCVSEMDNCSSPPDMREFTVVEYPEDSLRCSRGDSANASKSAYEKCSKARCDYSGVADPRDDRSYFLDTPLNTPWDDADGEAGDEGTDIELAKIQNASREYHISGQSEEEKLCCTTLGGDDGETVTRHEKNNSIGGSTSTSSSPGTPPTPGAAKRASEGWMAALLIGGLFLLIVLIICTIHFAQKMGRYCRLPLYRQQLATIDTGQVMYASSNLMDDADERTAISDITDI